MPYESLGLCETDVRRLAGTSVPRMSRLGSLLSPFLSELADTASSSRPPVGELLAWNAVNVLATLATERLGRDATCTPDARTPMMARILEFIDLHLTDEDLSPRRSPGPITSPRAICTGSSRTRAPRSAGGSSGVGLRSAAGT